MFDMHRIGVNVSRLRKETGLTQMELADRLNISFQAVSNWERGISMPDISKLNELSAIFGCTIDEMLENERASKIIEEIKGEEPLTDISADEMGLMMPILTPAQADDVAKRRGELDLSEIGDLAPFLSRELIDEIALSAFAESGTAEGLDEIVCFMSKDALHKIIDSVLAAGRDLDDIEELYPYISTEKKMEIAKAKFAKKNNLESISSLAPFLPKDFLCQCAKAAMENISVDKRLEIAQTERAKKNGLELISSIAPFLPKDFLCQCAKTAMENNDTLDAIEDIAPFLPRDYLNDLARAALNKRGLNALSSVMPFIDRTIVEEFIRERMKT